MSSFSLSLVITLIGVCYDNTITDVILILFRYFSKCYPATKIAMLSPSVFATLMASTMLASLTTFTLLIPLTNSTTISISLTALMILTILRKAIRRVRLWNRNVVTCFKCYFNSVQI